MRYQLIDVADISSDMLLSDFDEAHVEKLADAILENGGLVRPLLLTAAGRGKYEVLAGHMEYWASVRAREKNPRRGEVINAFVVDRTSAPAATGQLALSDGLKKDIAGIHGAGVTKADLAAYNGIILKAVDELIREFMESSAAIFETRLRETLIQYEVDKLSGLVESKFEEMGAMVGKLAESAPPAGAEKAKPSKSPKPLPEKPYNREKLDGVRVVDLKELMTRDGIKATGLKVKSDYINAILTWQEKSKE